MNIVTHMRLRKQQQHDDVTAAAAAEGGGTIQILIRNIVPKPLSVRLSQPLKIHVGMKH